MAAYRLEASAEEAGKTVLRQRVQETRRELTFWEWFLGELRIVWRFGRWLPLLFLLGVIWGVITS